MWRRAHEYKAASEAQEPLVYEAATFLSGRMSECIADQGRAVPDWVWLNALAHGDRDRISGLSVREDAGSLSRDDSWVRALGFLAAEVIAASGPSPVGLEELQRSVLVPLELDLLAQGDERLPLGPVQLVRLVLDALEEHRTCRWRRGIEGPGNRDQERDR